MHPYKSVLVRVDDSMIMVSCKVKSLAVGRTRFVNRLFPYKITTLKGPDVSGDGILDQPFSSAAAVRVAIKRVLRLAGKTQTTNDDTELLQAPHQN